MQDLEKQSSIDLAALRSAIDLIFDHIEHDLKIKALSVALDKEYYWDMNVASRFAVAEEPPTLSIGKISDDLEFLLQMVREAEGDSSQAPSVMLLHVTPILLFLANTVGS